MLAKCSIITFHLFNLYIDLFENYLELACCLPVPVLDDFHYYNVSQGLWRV